MSDEPWFLDRMTDRTRKVMRIAAAFSRQFTHHDIEPHDLLDALAHMRGISDYVLADFGYLKKKLPKPIPDDDRILDAAEWLKPIVAEAHEQASLLGHNYVRTEHVLLAIMRTNPELLPNPHEVSHRVLQALGHEP